MARRVRMVSQDLESHWVMAILFSLWDVSGVEVVDEVVVVVLDSL